VFTVSTTYLFKKQMFIKMSSCYCKSKTKRKLVLCENSVIIILLARWTQNFTCADVVKPTTVHILMLWLQVRCRRWPHSKLLRILRLKPDATFVMWWTMGCPFFCIFCSWHVSLVTCMWLPFFCYVLICW